MRCDPAASRAGDCAARDPICTNAERCGVPHPQPQLEESFAGRESVSGMLQIYRLRLCGVRGGGTRSPDSGLPHDELGLEPHRTPARLPRGLAEKQLDRGLADQSSRLTHRAQRHHCRRSEVDVVVPDERDILGNPHFSHERERLQQPDCEQVIGCEHGIRSILRRSGEQRLPRGTPVQHRERRALDHFDRRARDSIHGCPCSLQAIRDLSDRLRATHERELATTEFEQVSCRHTATFDIVHRDRGEPPALHLTVARIGADLPVVAVGSHDTASAVVAAPLSSDNAAYISCGTWGLVGLETAEPVLTDAAREANFTNELGVDGRIRFLHNVTGLWLLSETIKAWEAEDGAAIDPSELLDAAASVKGEIALFDANDSSLSAPSGMPERIAAVLRSQGASVPESRPGFARVVVESIAAAFADAVQAAAEISDREVDSIQLVGGGSLNRLLCQATADRAGLPVLAGPVEATALGNVLVQARALGAAPATLEELRTLVARTHSPVRFDPR